MKRAYKYRFHPTTDQVELLAQTFGCARFVYNSILRWRTDAYYKHKEKIGYTQASARLTAMKKSQILIGSMTFQASLFSKHCATNKQHFLTSLLVGLNIQLSKASDTNSLPH
jgi:transposase